MQECERIWRKHVTALDTGREKKEWQINVNDLREQSEAQGKKKKKTCWIIFNFIFFLFIAVAKLGW